jgi:hypothetical protein
VARPDVHAAGERFAAAATEAAALASTLAGGWAVIEQRYR